MAIKLPFALVVITLKIINVQSVDQVCFAMVNSKISALSYLILKHVMEMLLLAKMVILSNHYQNKVAFNALQIMCVTDKKVK